MQLFIDESGNTGQPLVQGEGLSNFNEQPFFTLAGILATTADEMNGLTELVDQLKKDHRIQSPELKAKNVYETRPQLIYDLFNHLFDNDIPFFWELMDKKYYLCMQITNTVLLPPFSAPIDNGTLMLRRTLAEQLYYLISDGMLGTFCNTCLEPSAEAFEQLIAGFSIERTEQNNDVVDQLDRLVKRTQTLYAEMKAEEGADIYKRFMPLPDTDKRSRTISILPNTHAFTNMIARCQRYRLDHQLSAFTIIHDEQKHFDEIFKANFEVMKNLDTDLFVVETFIAEQSTYKIDQDITIRFADSQQFKVIQLADVLAGFINRSWDDFFNGRFPQFNRYVEIWKAFILPDREGEETHRSLGANMVIPGSHHAVLVKHLRKF